MKNILSLYNEVDKIIPWENYEGTSNQLDRYRHDYTKESSEISNEIKVLLEDAAANYLSSTQNIYEWCSSAKGFLSKYRQLFETSTSETPEAQKALLLTMLDDGLTKMSPRQVKFEQYSMNFKNAAEKLTTLQSQLANDFDAKSRYFESKVNEMEKAAYAGSTNFLSGPFGLIVSYSPSSGAVRSRLVPALQKKLNEVKHFVTNLSESIDATNSHIDTTEVKLRDEISKIGDLKDQIERTDAIPFDQLDAIRDNVLGSVDSLIGECETYQKDHGSN